MKLLPLLLGTLLCVAGTSVLAQWQWVDKDGRKVFSDRAPPPDVPDRNILRRPGAPGKLAADAVVPSPVAAAPADAAVQMPKASGTDKELEARKKQLAEAEAAQAKAQEEKVVKARVENCARAKQAKATLDSGIRVSKASASGEREFLDDAARAEELKRIQGVISSDCQ
jgi:L-fucose mutarotase/ribose pyranase (RbsD/FucU family)